MERIETFKKKFRFRIADLRTESKLSGEEFGKLFNVGKTAVHNWEIGRNWPDTDVLIAISEHFDISIDFLTGKSDFKHSMPKDGSQYIIDAKEALGIVTANFDEFQKNSVENMVKMFEMENKDKKKSITAIQTDGVSAKVKK